MSKPPTGLSRANQKWYRQLAQDFDIVELHAVEILTQAVKTKQVIDDAEKLIAKAGLLVKDRHGADKVHPLVVEVRQQRSTLRLLLRELGLDAQLGDSVTADSFRPPRLKVG